MAKQKVAPAPNKPVHEIRHRNIRAAIWKNPTKNGSMYTVTVSRMYKKDEKWHDTQSFHFEDLMTVAKAMSDAHTVVSQLMNRENAAKRAANRTETVEK